MQSFLTKNDRKELVAVKSRAEQKTDFKPKSNRNREKPEKTDPNITDPKPKPKNKKPNRFKWFGSGYTFQPNR